MTFTTKNLGIPALGLIAVMLGPVAYAAAEDVVVVHDHASHHERVRERRAEERAEERARIHEHERREAERERERERHDRHEVIIRP